MANYFKTKRLKKHIATLHNKRIIHTDHLGVPGVDADRFASYVMTKIRPDDIDDLTDATIAFISNVRMNKSFEDIRHKAIVAKLSEVSVEIDLTTTTKKA